MKSIILRIFNADNIEVESKKVPGVHVKTGLDYKWILWFFGRKHAKNPIQYSHWDTETYEGGSNADMTDNQPQNLN
jgi:hypothetical protein